MLGSFTCARCSARFDIDADSRDSDGQIPPDLSCPHCGTEIKTETPPRPVHIPAQNIRTVISPTGILGSGITLGEFVIKRLLGVGTMGKVYLAHQISMDRNVALKVLGAEILTLPHLVQRFQNEVRMAALVDHAHIVKAFGAGEDSGFHYLAMEYVSGGSLRERLEREGFLPERDALEITYKVATALREAWEDHSILHRDIKPENIMLTDRGEPKLADLGLSKSLIPDLQF